MKNNYKKITPKLWFNTWKGEWEVENWGVGRYTHNWDSWHYRYVKTWNERRQNYNAKQDGHKVRGKRTFPNLPSVWDDIRISRIWGRSWKDYTKQRKQWG
jgi:hypothetical protein